MKEAILAWLTAHAWAPIVGLGIFVVVRLTKADVKLTPIPGVHVTVPAWIRPIVGLASGIALASLVKGQDWSLAIDNGLVALILAILAHEGIIEGARGGEELPVPTAMRQPPGIVIPKPPSVPSFPAFPDAATCVTCNAPTDPAPPPIVSLQ